MSRAAREGYPVRGQPPTMWDFEVRFEGQIHARWLDGERLATYPQIAFAIFALLGLTWVALSSEMIDSAGQPLGREFLSYFGASALALADAPIAAYEGMRLTAAQAAALPALHIPPNYVWQYSPVALLMALPLAYMPYAVALAVWLAFGFGAYFAMARGLSREPAVLWPLIAFPAVFVNLGQGQSGLLAAALMGGALLLVDRRPVLAGLLAGALLFNPHLGLLLPLAFLAAQRWRAVGATMAAAAALAAVSYHLFGIETWEAFVQTASASGWSMAAAPDAPMQSLFAAVRLLGGGIDMAYAVHGTIGGAAAVAALWIWRQPVSLEIRGAALVCATLLANPFLRDYDLVLLALPVGLLLVQGRRDGFHPWEGGAIVVAWLIPLLSQSLAPDYSVPVAPVAVILLLALILHRISVTALDAEPGVVGAPIVHGAGAT